MNVFSFLFDRIKEPGTLRSLIWVLLSVAGYSVTDVDVAQYALTATTILGVVSALMPEKKAVVPVAQIQETKDIVAETRSLLDVVVAKVSK